MNSVVEYVANWANKRTNNKAIISRDGELSYGDLYKKAVRYASYLADKGISKGDVVILRASQDIEFAIIYLGIHSSGGVVCSLENSISADALLKICHQVGGKHIIADDVCDEAINIIYRTRSLAESDCANWDSLVVRLPQKEDLADLLFTTGTTGASKGVMLSHDALVATAENLIYGCKYLPDTVIITPGPLNHANAIRKMFTSFVNGSTVYVLNGMKNLKNFYDAIENSEGTVACCLPPAMIRNLFKLTGDKLGEYKDKIDFIESATSPLPEADKEHLISLLPNTRLYNNYGSSEAASVCILEYSRFQHEADCIGEPMPNSEVFIVDDDKKRIKSSKDNPGLIACSGRVVMNGYLGEEELTKEVLVNGVVYTNDIGYEKDGFLYIVGRRGDVINLGGFKIAPTEVESVALYYPGVQDCIMIPVKDGETVVSTKILLVADESKFDKKDFINFMSGRLEQYKVPRQIKFIDSVKKTFNGKVDRKAYI